MAVSPWRSALSLSLALCSSACGADEVELASWCAAEREVERVPPGPEYVYEVVVDELDRTWFAVFGFGQPQVEGDEYELLLRVSAEGEVELERRYGAAEGGGLKGAYLRRLVARPGGGVCSPGMRWGPGPSYHEELICYGDDGEIEWQRPLADGAEGPGGLAIDGQGQLYLSASVWAQDGSRRARVLSYSSSGELRWARDLPGSVDLPGPVQVGDGRVYVSGSGHVLSVAAFGLDAAPAWTWSGEPQTAYLRAVALSVDPERIDLLVSLDSGDGDSERYTVSREGQLLAREPLLRDDSELFPVRTFEDPAGARWATFWARAPTGLSGEALALRLDDHDAALIPDPLSVGLAPGEALEGRHLSTGELSYVRELEVDAWGARRQRFGCRPSPYASSAQP